MKSIRWIVPVILMHSAMSIAQDDSGAPRVPAPSEIDPILISTTPAGPRTQSSAAATSSLKLKLAPIGRLSTGRQTVAPIGIMKFSGGLLSRPVETEADLTKPVVVMGLPSSMARLDFQLDGKEYQLYFGNDASDTRTGFRHVTMNVLNDARATARFTISGDGRSVYGVLRTNDLTYVFEPSGTPGEQIVYRYQKTLAVDDRRRGIVGDSSIAKRHHQLETVAAVRPDSSYSDAYSSFLVGGNLGTIKSVTPAAFVRTAERLSALTQLTGAEKFELASQRQTQDGGQLAIFRQTVGGIPVDAVNEMLLDRNGKVLQLTTSIVPQDAQAVKPLLSAGDAQAKTRVHWEASYGRRNIELQTEAPLELRYRLDRTTNVLEPSYNFIFNVSGEISRYHAVVNAFSGSVELNEIAWNNVTYTACQDLPSAGPNQFPPIATCTAPNARKGYSNPPQAGYCNESSTYPANSYCATTQAKTAAEVMSDIRNHVPGATATNAPGTPACCNEVSDVVVIQGSRIDNLYSSTTANTKIYMPPQESESEEILGHEMGHVLVNVYNNDVLEVDTNVFAGAVREGTADTFSGLLGAITGRTNRYGSKWTYGDGHGYSGGTRNASNPSLQYWQDIKVPPGTHASGQVISRFFRRIQEITGISDQRLLGIVVGTMAASRDLELNGYDAGDFRRAVLSTIKPEETALRNAVHQVYQELYRADATAPGGAVPLPPGDPGPIGAPSITPSVWGAFSYCGYRQGVYVSFFDMYWTATPNTNRYLGWVKASAEPAFRFSDETTGTHFFVLTNTTGEARVSSCNGSGCSGMSDRLTVSHVCGG